MARREESVMARLRDDPRRMTLDAYADVIEMRASYADVDSFQHLNNVALARFFEEGRATLNMSVFGVDSVVRPSDSVQLLFASIVIDYVSQGHYPGVVQVGTAISKIGRASFDHIAGLFQDGRCIALCDTVSVYAIAGKSAELPPEARAALTRFLIPS
jgi:acyl-CoA thioester hydrolase